MGIFGYWLLWQTNKLLAQIRRDRLTPSERVLADAAERAEFRARSRILILLLAGVLTLATVLGVFIKA
jgi:hypothetical protein